ncbi:MAG: hypothetical protein DI636_06775 [Pelagerythrobacter marensis]|nr:MAG: hypothetical protein DI636_06775 [Pelagerythrobacter marensis]
MNHAVLSTPFRTIAHGLISPMAERFEPAPWKEAFAGCSATEADDRLLRSALWTGERAGRLYAAGRDRLALLNGVDATVLAVATINELYRLIAVDAKAAVRSAAVEGALSFDALINTRVDNGSGLRLPSSDFLETLVDSMDAWIFDAARTGGGPFDTSSGADAGAISSALTSFYTMRHVLKRLWDRALHLGYWIDDSDTWRPPDRGLAVLNQAWQARNDAVFLTAPARLSTAWVGMEPAQRREMAGRRTVTQARVSGKIAKLRVGRSTFLGKRPPLSILSKAGLRESYLAPFLSEPFPLFPALSVDLLDDAWWICEAAARAVTSLTLSLDRGRWAGLYANAVGAGELAAAIRDCLSIDDNAARQIIDFLTYSEQPKASKGKARGGDTHGWRGLWSAPLVRIDDGQIVLLPLAILHQSATLYRAEAWMEKGGLGDQGFDERSRSRGGRGVRFEGVYRRQLVEAVSANPLLRDTVVAPDGVRKQEPKGNQKGFSEEIDVLIKFGRRLLVGELKFLLTPDDPHRWSRFYENLDQAAEQAERKASSLSSRPDIMALELGLSESKVRGLPVTPIVIVNGGFGFSLKVRDCRVVDGMFQQSGEGGSEYDVFQ